VKEELISRSKVHDASKLEEPELTPYIYITWMYKKKDDGEDFKVPEGIEKEMSKATYHHVTTNDHHPEYWAEEADINLRDRDSASDTIVVPDVAILEMVADWSAMGAERGNKAKDWADKNIGIRWKFTPDQVKLIYQAIDIVDTVMEHCL
jgi:hypothetical protein